MTIIQILALLLALSVAGNAFLAKVYLGARDTRAQAVEQRDQARTAASVCSDATEALQDAALARKKENQADVAKAHAAGVQRERRAQLQLSTPATRPGDDCGSAGDRFNDWLQGRAP